MKEYPTLTEGVAMIHWLGGKHVTPKCGAWAFAKGERTDNDYIPERSITCAPCLAELKKRKREYYRYLSRKDDR